jgi:L-asparaginase
MSITLFTLGGTIAMAGAKPGGNGEQVVTRLTGAQLVEAVPGLAGVGMPLDVRDAVAVPSASLTFAQLFTVVEAARDAIAAGAAGVVVTQGTDTLEETAFLLDLVWPHATPIVLTGAMRNPTLAGADGPANLLAAARVAASPEARDLGALVVFNDDIHAARWVRKTHATSTATFVSPNVGPIGHVIEGQVRVLARPARRESPLTRPDLSRIEQTRVAIYTASLDDDGSWLATASEICQGLVVAGFGVGHVPSALAPVLGALSERMPVVLTSATGAGSVLRSTYGAVGSETDLQRRGLINGGLLDPRKARVLLRLLIAAGCDRARIGDEFARRG